MAFHLRYTPYKEVANESITEFLSKYDKFIAAYEQTDKKGEDCEPHYHMYIEFSGDIDTIRYRFKKHFELPTGKNGESNKYYSLKKWNKGDIGYVVKQQNIVCKKGITEEEIEETKNKKIHLPPAVQRSEATGHSQEKEERKDEWSKILDHFIALGKEKRNALKVSDIKKEICKMYLRKLRPVPRHGDLNRYAFSLYAIFQSKFGEDEQALENLTSDYNNENVIWE